jgi:hypothetical protein
MASDTLDALSGIRRAAPSSPAEPEKPAAWHTWDPRTQRQWQIEANMAAQRAAERGGAAEAGRTAPLTPFPPDFMNYSAKSMREWMLIHRSGR